MTKEYLEKLVRTLSVLAIAASILGASASSTYVFSAKLEDIVGAGFGLVMSAILFCAGLISLAILSNKK